jgi:hypothetical protein
MIAIKFVSNVPILLILFSFFSLIKDKTLLLILEMITSFFGHCAKNVFPETSHIKNLYIELG